MISVALAQEGAVEIAYGNQLLLQMGWTCSRKSILKKLEELPEPRPGFFSM